MVVSTKIVFVNSLTWLLRKAQVYRVTRIYHFFIFFSSCVVSFFLAILSIYSNSTFNCCQPLFWPNFWSVFSRFSFAMVSLFLFTIFIITHVISCLKLFWTHLSYFSIDSLSWLPLEITVMFLLHSFIICWSWHTIRLWVITTQYTLIKNYILHQNIACLIKLIIYILRII